MTPFCYASELCLFMLYYENRASKCTMCAPDLFLMISDAETTSHHIKLGSTQVSSNDILHTGLGLGHQAHGHMGFDLWHAIIIGLSVRGTSRVISAPYP